MAHGTFHKNSIGYSVIVEGCKDDTLNLISDERIKCKNDTTKYFTTAYFYFINNYIDVLNYKNPTTKFLYRIENGVYAHEYYINNLNFNPSKVSTHNGLIFDNEENEESYIYDRNDVSSASGDEIYIAYSIWLKSDMHYYERDYKRVQDVMSNIGGISQFVIIVATYINSFYNKYIVLKDTDQLLFSSTLSNEERHIKKELKFKKPKKELTEPEKNDINNFMKKS